MYEYDYGKINKNQQKKPQEGTHIQLENAFAYTKIYMCSFNISIIVRGDRNYNGWKWSAKINSLNKGNSNQTNAQVCTEQNTYFKIINGK